MKTNKKIIGFVSILATFTLALAACGTKEDDNSYKGGPNLDEKILMVGASPTPHAEILHHVAPYLKEKGYTLTVVNFDDYVLPNKALAEGGTINANFFQHIPFLNKQNKENGYDLVNAGAVHLEPIGLYSKTLKDIKDLKDGATIITSNSESDWGRVISVLQEAGLVKVKSGVNLETATFDDISENPKNLKFNHSINPELLTTTYQNDEGDLIAINSNFALNIDLNPLKDALLIEKDDSPYVNIIAVRKGDENKPAIKALVEALHEKEVQDWILEKWHGSVKPVDAEAK